MSETTPFAASPRPPAELASEVIRLREMLASANAQRDQARARVERLRGLLGWRPGDDLCGVTSGGLNPMRCLLPARHVDEMGNGWHAGIGGAWTP